MYKLILSIPSPTQRALSDIGAYFNYIPLSLVEDIPLLTKSYPSTTYSHISPILYNYIKAYTRVYGPLLEEQ